jgi:nucleotide-binding universal stress UspA family protein
VRLTQRKVLVAVDGSEQALRTVRYVGRVLPGDRTKITLLHVTHWLPEAFWDFESDPGFRRRMRGFGSWRSGRAAMVEEFMEQATALLRQAQYPAHHITIHVKDRQIGIARDILREAKKGYAALVLGRRGLSPLKELTLGSTAQKVVYHAGRIPVWVVGGQPDPSRILLAADKSDSTVRIFDYVTNYLGLRDKDLLLLHVIRRFELPVTDGVLPAKSARWLGWFEGVRREATACEREVMESLFRQRIRAFEETGGDTSRVRTKIVQDASSRAGSVLAEAEQGGYGTIVVGRKGLSRVEEFLMGRVSGKVLQMAKERAVLMVH